MLDVRLGARATATATDRDKARETHRPTAGNCTAVCLPSSIRRTQHFECAECGRVSAFDAEFFKDVTEMLFHREVAHTKDCSNLHVGFALGGPEEDFGFAGGQAELEPKGLGGTEV